LRESESRRCKETVDSEDLAAQHDCWNGREKKLRGKERRGGGGEKCRDG
jgi:hypothetical protein